MDDRIDHIDSSATPELVYQVLDKLSKKLNTEDTSLFQGQNFSCTRESTVSGMTIKLRRIHHPSLAAPNKAIKFIGDNVNKKVTIFLEQQDWLSPHTVATLYEENSESCKNFLAQIKNEEKKIGKILDEILEELDRPKPLTNKEKLALEPKIEETHQINVEPKEQPTMLQKMLLCDTPWYKKFFDKINKLKTF